MEWEELKARIDEIIEMAEVKEPPVDPFQIARVIKERVREGKLLEGLSHMAESGLSIPEAPSEESKGSVEDHLAAAEGIVRALISGGTSGESVDELCRRGAAYLLLPDPLFEERCRELDFNLYRLKEIFPNVSYETIALRTLDLRQAVVTLYEKDRTIYRRGSEGFSFPKELHMNEIKVLRDVARMGQKVRLQHMTMTVEAWPIFDEREGAVVLVTIPD